MIGSKIVCTIGPPTQSDEILQKLIDAGMDVARLNLSHGNIDWHLDVIDRIRKLSDKVAILLDTKGPEIRTGNVEDSVVELVEGNTIVLTPENILGTSERVNVNYKALAKDVSEGSTILLDDGLIELRVTKLIGHDVKCEILSSGRLENTRGVNIPGVFIDVPSVTAKDLKDIAAGIKAGIDFIALSFIRSADDISEIREVLKGYNSDVKLIAKIEHEYGVKDFDAILEASDGIMVARGDLGVEIDQELVPLVQKDIIAKCNLAGKPVITATQMLESMIENPRPTRAEVSDIYNAIIDGTDAVMLSGETSKGKYPLRALKIMRKIADKADTIVAEKSSILLNEQLHNEEDIIFRSAYRACEVKNINKIICFTSSGHTPRFISRYKPKADIIAVTYSKELNRQFRLSWGVVAIHEELMDNSDQYKSKVIQRLIEENLVSPSDDVVFTYGYPFGNIGTTNVLEIHKMKILMDSFSESDNEKEKK